MVYTQFKDKKISRLALGLMRLPQTEQKTIDREKAFEMIDYAYANGVNYFDTAYFYHAGESQRIAGEALNRYPRDTWFIGSKMPGNVMKAVEGGLRLEIAGFGMENVVLKDAAEIFESQLANCGVDYFDFYMLHNVSEDTYDIYTNKDIGIVDYLIKQRNDGRIKHLGFSSHARPETIQGFLDLHPKCFEFSLIQLNYLDAGLQEAEKKYEVLTKNGLAVFVMEPLRGGKLATLDENSAKIFKAANPNASLASWAFRYLQAFPNIKTVLSGMSTLDQLKENIELFTADNPLNEQERQVLQQVIDEMAEFIPCTACGYCTASCPKELNIPMLISTYNEAAFDMSWTVKDVLSSLNEDKQPHSCIECGACRPLCPQNIEIPQILSKFAGLYRETDK